MLTQTRCAEFVQLAGTTAMCGIIGLLVCSGASAQQPTSARDETAAIRDQIRAAHAKGDGAAYVATSRRLEEFLNDSPQSILQLMSAQTFAGDVDGALQSLGRFIQMGQADENTLAAKPFEGLRKSPKFAALQAEMVRNNEPIARATEVFRMEKTDLIPEDLDYDSRTSRFFVTSVLQKEILTFDSKGTSKIFAKAPDDWPMMALKIDFQRRMLWATEVALKGYKWSPESAWGRSVVLIYDLDSGKLLHRVDALPKATFGDMTLTRDGDAILSDNEGGGIYRMSRQTLKIERLDEGGFVSPQTATFSADGRRLFVPDYSRGIGILDLETKNVTWLASGGLHALNGSDGIYLDGTTLLATQNGASPERVIAFRLDATLTRVVSELIIERATPSLGDPTHGVIVKGTFYYIANSGWDAVEDDGSVKAGAAMTNPQLMQVDLGSIRN